MTRLGIVIATLAVFMGCNAVDEAKRKRLDNTQQDMLGQMFGVFGTIAGMMDDPTTAGPDDFQTAVTLDPYVLFTLPELAPADPFPTFSADVQNCLTENTATSVAFTDCQIAAGTDTCTVHAAGTKQFFDGSGGGGAASSSSGGFSSASSVSGGGPGPGVIGTQYEISITIGGSGVCPNSALAFSIFMEGESDNPEVINGFCDYGENDGDLNVYSGRLEVQNVAKTGSCTVPSTGRILNTISGRYRGNPVKERIAAEFFDQPNCGDIGLSL